ncbi:hypothetical protein L9F63_027504, partial [Diploptera punctata]
MSGLNPTCDWKPCLGAARLGFCLYHRELGFKSSKFVLLYECKFAGLCIPVNNLHKLTKISIFSYQGFSYSAVGAAFGIFRNLLAITFLVCGRITTRDKDLAFLITLVRVRVVAGRGFAIFFLLELIPSGPFPLNNRGITIISIRKGKQHACECNRSSTLIGLITSHAPCPDDSHSNITIYLANRSQRLETTLHIRFINRNIVILFAEDCWLEADSFHGRFYGCFYLYERMTWTNKAKEREFKRQYVDHATKKLRLIVDLTSANCSHQVQQELSSTFARLCHLVDEATNDMDSEIKILDKEIRKLEEAANSAKVLRNKANYITKELEMFDDAYLKSRD